MSKALKKIGVIGHFGFGETLSNGQTVKTKIVTEALDERYSPDEVMKEDTHGGIKALARLPFQIIRALRRAENILIIPAQRGVRVTAPLLTLFNRFYRRRLHYCVIGGWLPGLIKDKKALTKQLRSFNALYVETHVVEKALNAMGFDNVFAVPNCKPLKPTDISRLNIDFGEPYRLCTFSRVMREKGIEDAVNAVSAVNESCGRTVFSLDIFGQVDSSQTQWFDDLKKSFPDHIRYMGVVPYDKSVETLEGYFALLFPTRFYTEGIPGTVIDAYAAGVPVISSRWESFSDIITDGVTGLGYDFGDYADLVRVLSDIADSPEGLIAMKPDCVRRAEDYLPQNALKALFEQID